MREQQNLQLSNYIPIMSYLNRIRHYGVCNVIISRLANSNVNLGLFHYEILSKISINWLVCLQCDARTSSPFTVRKHMGTIFNGAIKRFPSYAQRPLYINSRGSFPYSTSFAYHNQHHNHNDSNNNHSKKSKGDSNGNGPTC